MVILTMIFGICVNSNTVLAQVSTEIKDEEDNDAIENVSENEDVQRLNVEQSSNNMENINIDINEIILLVVGAGIGIVASVATMLGQQWIDKKGKLHIFYRFTYQKGFGKTGWGFGNSESSNIFFSIPVEFELQNTSNTTRVIRDLSLLLYDGEVL